MGEGEEIREEHRESLKKFKSPCRLKKKEFWKDEARKIENVQGNNSEFWKEWKNLGEESIMTELGNVLDLINQSVLTPKHVVSITISLLKGTWLMGNICPPQMKK